MLILNLTFANENLQNESFEYEINDPLEGYNRVMTAINGVFYDYIMYPISYSYDYVIPDPIQGLFQMLLTIFFIQ